MAFTFFAVNFRVDRVKECHAVSLAQLATEQDRLYHQLEELRSVNDVIEEVLDKANPYQLQAAYTVCSFGVNFCSRCSTFSSITLAESD